MILKFIKLTVLLFLLSFSLNAQEYEKINGAWNAVFIDHGLSDKISIRSEFHLRTVSFLSVWNQQIFRPSISFNTLKNIKWSLGYSFIKNFNRDITVSPRVRLEHNFWEQLIYNTPTKKGMISSRLRLEHRFLENLTLHEERSLKSFDFASRIRYRLSYQHLLTPPGTKRPINFVAFDEVFIFLNPSGAPFRFNLNWTFFGLKLQLNKKMVLNTGFQKNTLKVNDDNYLSFRLWTNTLIYKL
jgi:hypothetical protein